MYFNFISIQEWRDWSIIVFTSTGAAAFLASLLLMIFVGYYAIRLLSAIRNTVENGVTPLLSSFRETANSVRGTTAFVTETAVSPIIRILSVVAGVRRALGVLLGFGRRGRR
ncbi:MAG: hypothetical protein ACE5IZ_05000 [Dehalococcoidia bacterium]